MTLENGYVDGGEELDTSFVPSSKPKTPEEKIELFRRIVKNCACEKVDGTLVDLFSASVVCQVYDALKPENQAKFMNRSVTQIALLAYKLIA
jgi:hypothetical protein